MAQPKTKDQIAAIKKRDAEIKKKKERKIETVQKRKDLIKITCPICRKRMMLVNLKNEDVKKYFHIGDEPVYVCVGLFVNRDNQIGRVAEYGLPQKTIMNLIADNQGQRVPYREFRGLKHNLKATMNIDIEAAIMQMDEHWKKVKDEFDGGVVE